MMVFFVSNMIENQCMSTGAFEITLNGKTDDELQIKILQRNDFTLLKLHDV